MNIIMVLQIIRGLRIRRFITGFEPFGPLMMVMAVVAAAVLLRLATGFGYAILPRYLDFHSRNGKIDWP